MVNHLNKMASVLAIDFGNENLVIAAPRKGGVDIILNQSSQRLTPSMVAFSETRRFAGEFARNQQMQNVNGTITNLKRLIGLQYDSPDRETIQKLVPFPLVKLDDGYIGIQANYLDDKKTFRIEQCIALLLKEVFEIARVQNIHASDCVIVCSPWWDECQRRQVLDAAKIAGFHVLKLLNSTTAQAILYSMYHRKRLPEEQSKAVPVAFVDFGDSAMNVAIASMSQGQIEVKGFTCDEHLGGSDFTTALVNMLLEKTKAKYKIDPRTSPRALLRFTQAAEKLKKSLSINPIMPFDVQSCLDCDINFMVKREEFEAVIQDLIARIEQPIINALKLANVKKEDLFAIEVHGGASRVAAVKAKINEIFGKEPTQSLNPDECFALGAGFQAAILSPQYRVELKVKDVAPHQVMIEWIDDQGEKKTNELFKQFNVVPCTKVVPVKVKRNAHVRLFNEQTGELGTINIDTGTDEVLTVRLKIRLTPDGIIDVIEAIHQIQEEIVVKEEPKKEEPKKEEPKKEEAKPEEKKEEGKTEEKKEESKPEEKKEESKPEEKKEEAKPEEKKEEEKPKTKIIKKDIPVNFIFKAHYGLTPDQISKFQAEEKQMFNRDKQEQEIDNTRNELESYIFKMESGINRDFPEYFDPAKKDEYLKKVEEVQMWFSENEFDRLPLNEYQKELRILKEFGEPALNRRKARFEIPNTIADLIHRAEAEKTKLDTKDEKFSHITQEERDGVRKLADEYIAWIKQKQEEVEKAPKHLDAPFKTYEANTKLANVETKVRELFCKPKPTPPPKKEEEKKDEKKEGGAEEEKKEGGAEEEKKEGEEAPKTEEKPAADAKPEEPKKDGDGPIDPELD